jgi:nuclear pore complex protein Nup188
MSLMERLLKTLRYNFLTEALDFVGVHQERTLQVRGYLRHRREYSKPLSMWL